MLTLKLYPAEVMAMLGYLKSTYNPQNQPPLRQQTLHALVLLAYLASWKPPKVITWFKRTVEVKYKKFTLSLPLPAANALHTELQQVALTPHLQLFLNSLDQAIINYQDPSIQLAKLY